jgi:hypothetical protein
VLALPGTLRVTCLSLLLYPHSSVAGSGGLADGAGKCLLLAVADADGAVRLFGPRPGGHSHSGGQGWRCVATLPHEVSPSSSSSISSSMSSSISPCGGGSGDTLLPHPLSPAARVRDAQSLGSSAVRRLGSSQRLVGKDGFSRERAARIKKIG